MKILASIDKSREGNDCYIYEEWSLLVSSFGKKMIIVCYMNTYDRKVEIRTYEIHGEFTDSDDPEIQFMYESLMKKKDL